MVAVYSKRAASRDRVMDRREVPPQAPATQAQQADTGRVRDHNEKRRRPSDINPRTQPNLQQTLHNRSALLNQQEDHRKPVTETWLNPCSVHEIHETRALKVYGSVRPCTGGLCDLPDDDHSDRGRPGRTTPLVSSKTTQHQPPTAI